MKTNNGLSHASNATWLAWHSGFAKWLWMNRIFAGLIIACAIIPYLICYLL
jgi:hypothetical protein